MSKQQPETGSRPGISKVKLALGAASLFLFIVGIKRTFQVEEDAGKPPAGPPASPPAGE